MTIAATAVDTGYSTADVYRFVARAGRRRRVWAIKGWAPEAKKNTQRPIWPKRATKAKKRGVAVPLYSINVHAAKDQIAGRLRIEEAGPGFCHFPLSRDSDYFAQLTAEVRRFKEIGGHKVWYWFLPPGRRNEAIDLRVYALAALHGLYSMGRTLKSFTVDREARRKDPRNRPRRSRRRGGWLRKG